MLLRMKFIGQLPHGLAAEEEYVALVIHDRNRCAAIANITNDPATLAHLFQSTVPKLTHLNLLSRRGSHQVKSAIRRQTEGDRAAAGLELIGSARGKITVKVDIA